VTQTRRTAEYVRHAMTCPDAPPRFRVRLPARAPFVCQEMPQRDKTCYLMRTAVIN